MYGKVVLNRRSLNVEMYVIESDPLIQLVYLCHLHVFNQMPEKLGGYTLPEYRLAVGLPELEVKTSHNDRSKLFPI